MAGRDGEFGRRHACGDAFERSAGQAAVGLGDNALDAPAIWRYSTRDALSSPGVPAVDAFKKLIAEAEKQQAAKP